MSIKSITTIFMILIIGALISCTSNLSEEKKENQFTWGEPELKESSSDSILAISHTITTDGKALTILFDKGMRFHFPKELRVDTTLKLTIKIPFSAEEEASFNIKNDLRFFYSKDYESEIGINITVPNKNFEIPSINKNSDDSLFSFSYTLDKNSTSNSLYIFTINLKKQSSESDLIFEFDSLDIIASRQEE